jgi:hypothetical protein
MEVDQLKKPFVNIIVMYFIWVAMCITIVSMLTTIMRADVNLGGSPAITSILGVILASTFGFGVGGLGITLSIAGITIGPKKPEIAKAFGITNFVLVLCCLGTMIAGSILLGAGIADVIDCSLNNPSSLWRANCLLDIGYNITIVICMVVIAIVSIIGIVNSVKVVTVINKTVPRTGFVSTPPAAAQPIQPVAASGSQGKFCSVCGAPNEPDAKFCKKCGKAC